MLPPGLSMLWETVEPEQALRTRFGFDGLDAAVGWLSETLSEVWAVAVADCGRLVISDRNAIIWVKSSHGPLVVKLSSAQHRFASLATSASIVRRLKQLGQPVAAPMEAPDGQVRIERDGPRGTLSVAVLPELPGGWLDVRDEVAVRAAGACLAELHQALRGYFGDQVRPVTEPEAVGTRVDRWLTDGDRGWAPAASSRLRSLVAGLPPLVDELQLVHNDFRAANILTRDSRITAVLDFDELRWGHRVDDLAKASVYLGTRFTDWRPTPLLVRKQLRAGYESVRPLEPPEDQWYDALVLWSAVRAVPDEFDQAGWAGVR